MKILVTGGAGFIGSNYVLQTVEQRPDARVTVVDSLSYAANRSSLDPVADAISFVEGSIADAELTDDLVRDADVVVNFAAESHNDRAIIDPSLFMRSNALGAQVLLECSRRHPVSAHLHVSTIEVYGELAAGREYFTEGSPLNAKTPYSAAKAAGDQIVRAYMQTYP